MQAAVEAIADLGLDNVRMIDVAQRAGMSPGHVTYYFETKTELLMQAIKWSEERFHKLIMDELLSATDPWGRLDRLIELAAAEGPGDPGWVLWFEVWSNASNDSSVEEIHEELDNWWRATTAGVIRYGQADGTFADVDPDRIATVLSALIDGLSIQLTLGVTSASRASTLEMCRGVARLLLDPSHPSPAATGVAPPAAAEA